MMRAKRLPKVQIVRTADAFAQTGEMLLDQMLEEGNLVYPFVVNVALSIELYIKSYLSDDDLIPFLEHEDGTITYQGFVKCQTHEHKLEKLYSKVPMEIRAKLESEFSKSNLPSRFASLEIALTKFSNSFVEGRFPYEKNGFKGGCISDLQNISSFLKSAIYELGEFRVEEKY